MCGATVRRESGGSNTCRRREKLGKMFLGRRSYRMAKALRDKSLIEKREAGEHARPPQGPRDRVKAGLLEPQTPGMEPHIHRHGMYGRCWREVPVSPFELSPRQTTASEGRSRGRTRDLRHARTFDSTEHGIAYRPRGRRSGRSSPRTGKPGEGCLMTGV